MKTTRIQSALLSSALIVVLAPAAALAQVQLPDDHVDFGIGFEDDSLELHWHDEEGGNEYAPDEAFAFIPLSSTLPRPAGAQWDFTGTTAGGTLYLAPAGGLAGVIFLGIGSEEIADGTFTDNTVSLHLDSVSGPGHFALWQTDGFGNPLVALSSFDGTDAFDVITGGHDHYNWGFTAPGLYELTFTVSGTVVGEISPITDTATFTFAVGTTPIPEPASAAALAGLAILGLATTRRRARAKA